MVRVTYHVRSGPDPRCPACHERLQPEAVHYVGGFAVCKPCSDTIDFSYLVAQICRRQKLSEYRGWCVSQGLEFWCPTNIQNLQEPPLCPTML